MRPQHGVFTISLDFELYWGVRDKRSVAQYRDNLLGVRRAIPEMLRLFSNNDIHATWATVGFLFCDDLSDLQANIPPSLPTYDRIELSPYAYIERAADLEPAYFFAPEMIDLIVDHAGQEIGTHTFSHYYCLEEGQTRAQFTADIRTAVEVARRRGIAIRSLVFPRNQWNPEYLAALAPFGIECYRGNESSWMHRASDDARQNRVQRAFRLVDAYLNISGHNTHDLSRCTRDKPFNFPASRFLRPYSARLAMFDKLRLKRITSAMDDAAINKRLFHLWWHPHNFGTHTKHNIDFLASVVEHYGALKNSHGMVSLNMSELCQLAGQDHA